MEHQAAGLSISFSNLFSRGRPKKVDTARKEIQNLKQAILNRYNGNRKDISDEETKVHIVRRPSSNGGMHSA